MNKLYRILPIEQVNMIIDLCEEYNLDYDIWNPEGMLMGDQVIEIGLSQKDWEKIS